MAPASSLPATPAAGRPHRPCTGWPKAPPATTSRRHLTNAASFTKPVTPDDHARPPPGTPQARIAELSTGSWAYYRIAELGALVAGAEDEFNARLAINVARFRNRVLADLRRRYATAPARRPV